MQKDTEKTINDEVSDENKQKTTEETKTEKKAKKQAIKREETLLKSLTRKSENNLERRTFYDENDIDFKKAADIIVKVNDLSFNKIDNIAELVKGLNSKSTVIGISGAQGSGKTTVIEKGLKGIYLKPKNLPNFFALIWLYFLLLLPIKTIYRKKVNDDISLRRWKYINLNIWNILGHREPSDYEGVNSTSFIIEDKDGEKRIKSFHEDENKVSWLFIKKAIWQTIVMMLGHTGHNKKIKSALINDSWEDKNKNVSLVTKSLLLYVVMTLFVIGIGVAVGLILKNGFEINNVVSAVSGATSTIITGTISILVTKYIEGHSTRKANELFVNPISNEAISNFITKKSRRRVIAIHVSELDRFNNWLLTRGVKENDKIIEFIVHSLTMLYKSINVNIIMEIDEDIKTILKSGSHGPKHADIYKKIFSGIIDVKVFDSRELSLELLKISNSRDDFNYGSFNEFSDRFARELWNTDHISWASEILFRALSSKKLLKSPLSWRNIDLFRKYYDELNLEHGKYKHIRQFVEIDDHILFSLIRDISNDFNIEMSYDDKTEIVKNNDKYELKIAKGFNDKEYIELLFSQKVNYFPYINFGGTFHQDKVEADQQKNISEIFKMIVEGNVVDTYFNKWPARYYITNFSDKQCVSLLNSEISFKGFWTTWYWGSTEKRPALLRQNVETFIKKISDLDLIVLLNKTVSEEEDWIIKIINDVLRVHVSENGVHMSKASDETLSILSTKNLEHELQLHVQNEIAKRKETKEMKATISGVKKQTKINKQKKQSKNK